MDSEWEANVYRHIRMVFPKEAVRCHEPILVLPESPHFPALNWKCDFQVAVPGRSHPLLIEAKGVLTRELKLILQAIAHSNPTAIENLIIVHSEIGVKMGRTLRTVNIHVLYQTLLAIKS